MPILLGLVWAGLPWLSLLVGLVAVVAVREFYRLGHALGAKPMVPFGMAWTLAMIANGHYGASFTVPVVGAGIVASLVFLLWRRRADGALADWASTLTGALYIGWPLSHALLIRELDSGRAWLLYAILVTFATDTAAFFVGRALGRRKMAPSISPGKTWEGGLGGLTGAILASLSLYYILSLPMHLWAALLMGAGIGVAAQVGDLAESLLKRSAGVKEAGTVIPGHGGVLDRLDSLVFTLLLVYYVVAWAQA
ncbi:MAG: phosphatidate cytidylyltransferase [Chloroflexi bacterium]|nr:phosphatidate cytidylyltransferase [Chloroflexota bacterium]